MWIGRDTIFDYFQDFYGDRITIEGIKKSCLLLKVKLTPQKVQDWLNKKAKQDGLVLDCDLSAPKDKESLIKKIINMDKTLENARKYILDKIDYSVYIESLDIYVEKCFKLCELFEMLAYNRDDKDLIKYFDITVEGDDILISDIDRISYALISNYMLALEAYIKANRYETYLNKIQKPIAFKYGDLLPKDFVLNYKDKIDEEFVSLTRKQIQQKEKSSLSVKDIEELSEFEDKLFVAYSILFWNVPRVER